MRRAMLRGLAAHKLRLALTFVAVLLGVSFMSGTFVLTDTMGRAFDDVFANAYGGVDVSVRTRLPFEASPTGPSQMREPVPEELVEAVRGVEGVARVEGSVGGFAQLVDKQGEAITTTGAPTLGFSWTGIGSPLTIREGRAPRAAGEVVIDARTARTHGFAVGDPIQILLLGPAEPFTIVGIAGFGTADNLAGATLATFDPRTAQRVLGKEGRYDSIDVEASEGVPADELATRVGLALPAGYEAVTGDQAGAEESASLKSVIGLFNTALLVFAGVALFVGAFIISNTFSMIVAQRAREFGLLRAVGASRRQILGSVLVEAALVGLVASAAGVVAGLGIASGLRGMLAAFGMEMPTTGTVLLPRTIVVALVVGPSVTVLSAIAPARRASRVTPVEAMAHGATGEELTTRRRLAAGAVLGALGVVLMAVGLLTEAGTPVANVGAGALLVFLAVALLAPAVARPLSRAIGWPADRLRGVTGRLARGNASRAPRRTASTAAALMIGLALVSFVAVVGSSIKASVDETVGRAFRADLIVQSTSPFGGFGFGPELARRLAAAPEVAASSPLRGGQWRDGQAVRSVSAADPATLGRLLDLALREGSESGLGTAGVLVHENVAGDRGLKAGDPLVMEFARTGEQQFTVAGVFGEGQLVGSYVVSLEAFERHFTEQRDFVVLLALAPGTGVAAGQAAVEQLLADFPNAEVLNRDQFREAQAGQLNVVLGLVSALLGLAILIALLGITNTLALSIIERTRELGLLRAVGMSRPQVRAMIRWESMIVALLGAFLGVVVGVCFGWAVVAALSGDGLGSLVVPIGQLAIYVALAGVAGLVAALLPARRAARLDILSAIATE